MLTGMFTIGPGTAVAEEPDGRGIKFVAIAVALGLGASVWLAALSLGASWDDGDGDFACVEDVRGSCGGAARAIPVELRDRFDSYEANSPGDEAAAEGRRVAPR